MRNLCDAENACKMAQLPFQANTNFWTWSIDFGSIYKISIVFPIKGFKITVSKCANKILNEV